MNHMKQRLARLEREAGATQGAIAIRIVYENGLDGTTAVAPWHVHIENGVHRVVHEGATHAEL
jgi:hypothetical protein